MTRLSQQGRAVLEALAQPVSGRLEIWRLVKQLQPRHGSPASTRASLSRTLRRLWQAGYVELENDRRVTLTETQAAADDKLAQLEADADGAYAYVLAGVASGRWPALFARGSQAEYVDYERRRLLDMKRNLRYTAAVLMPAGRERMSIEVSQRLTQQWSEVNRKAIA